MNRLIRSDSWRRPGAHTAAIRQPWLSACLAMVALLVTLMPASLAAGTSRGEHTDGLLLHLSAQQDSATPSPQSGLTEEIWFEAKIPVEMLPPSDRLTLGLWHSVWDAGMQYRFAEDSPGVNVLCVMSGGWAFVPDHEERVVRTATRPDLQPAPAGEETVVGPGDCALLHADTHRDERNAEPEPLDAVGIVIIPYEASPPADAPVALEDAPLGYILPEDWSSEPVGSLSLSLRQVMLAPGASAPEYAATGEALIAVTEGELVLTPRRGDAGVTHQVSYANSASQPVTEGEATQLVAGDAIHLSPGTIATLRNDGDAPARWWLITVEPGNTINDGA